MTHRAVGFGRGFPRAWLIPIGAITVLLGVAASGRLSRSIVADLIAWWPIWLGLVVAAFFLRERNVGSIRVAGLVPLVALAFVLLFTWAHLAGWPIMPSASQRLIGPDVESVTSASLVADIDGRVDVVGGSDYLYQVEPLMEGGVIGIPTANEQLTGTTVAIELEPPADPGLYGYAGWELALSTTPTWNLTLDGSVDADLTNLTLSGLSLRGAGTARLGSPTIETPVEIGGSFLVVIPDGVPAQVIGTASVPDTWTLTPAGATSPAGSGGWVLTVVGNASLIVRHS